MKVLGWDVEVGDRSMVGGLGVFPLLGATTGGTHYLTGPEALDSGLLEVGELDPAEFPLLAVTNLAEVPILLVEGEVLNGGDRDRTMNVTVLCPPRSLIDVPVSCVESDRWGARRGVRFAAKHAPGSLRAIKTVHLGPRTHEASRRTSDQLRVWGETERQSAAHAVHSHTSALDDVQREVGDRIGVQLDGIDVVRGQLGVVFTVDDRVAGMDLFDRTSTLRRYLRGIVAGHALDAPSPMRSPDPIRAIERFLAQVEAAGRDTGRGVGLGEEVLLHGAVAGIGLVFEGSLVHLAAFPVPEGSGGRI